MQLHKHLNQADKAKVRSTKTWKKLKKDLLAKNNLDYLTKIRLTDDFNCHHLDLRPDNYGKLDDITRFMPLNRNSHEIVHFLYNLYKNDPAILDRIKEIFDMMTKLSQD